jgi:hypothetical protein
MLSSSYLQRTLLESFLCITDQAIPWYFVVAMLT